MRGVEMKWITPIHPDLAFIGHRTLDFQAVKCAGIDISVRDVSGGTINTSQYGKPGDRTVRGNSGKLGINRTFPDLSATSEGAHRYSFLTSSTNKLIITICTIAQGGSQSGELET